MSTPKNTARTEELIKTDLAHIIHPSTNVGENVGIVFETTHDRIFMVDTNGKEYIDFNAGLMCCNLGHGQKEIQDAIVEAINNTDYTTQYYGFSNVYAIECARLLAEITPVDLSHFVFVSGGSDAIDSAVKIARLYWYRKGKESKQKIICLYNGYHGELGISTYLTRTGGGRPQRGFGAEPAGYIRIPNYYCYRCQFGSKYPDCDMLCASFLDTVIKSEGADSIAAFLVEPIQGSGGVINPPPEYLPMIRKICSDNDILLIADEVMSGFARTGKMFAMEHSDIVSDIMVMAKGITSAYIPLGAVALNSEIFETLKGNEFSHGITYSGHPIACAASAAALKLYKNQKVAENAAKVGNHIRQRLENEFLPLPCVGNIGGKGMFQAVELVNDKKSKAVIYPDAKLDLWHKILDRGIYLRITGALGNRMFITPPCTMTIEEADKAMDVVLDLVTELKPK